MIVRTTLLMFFMSVSASLAAGGLTQTTFLKALNAGQFDMLGDVMAMSGDTLVAGAPAEEGSQPGINPPDDNTMHDAGAAYVFVRQGTTWVQQARLKASNPGELDRFGSSVAISGDTIVVGAYRERSSTTGVNTTPDDLANQAGAAYVFVRTGGTWTQQAYLKASNTNADDFFGLSVAVSGDTIAVGALAEDSAATGVGGNESDNSAATSGAAYVFTRSGTTWTQQAYVKASNTDAGDSFGRGVALSGETLVVSAESEDSNATGVDSNQADNSAATSGAAYVFTRTAGNWSQQAYLKASNTGAGDTFGSKVAISGDTIVVSAPDEDGSNTGINPASSEGTPAAGAAYVFVRSGITWTEQAYIKAGNVDPSDLFGASVSISGDLLVVGAREEDSSATGVNGDATNNSRMNAGAAWYYTRSGTTWTQRAYLKASNPGMMDLFGHAVAVSDGVVAVAAVAEDSSTTGTNPPPNEAALSSGAIYIFEPLALLGLAHSGYSAPGGLDIAFGKMGSPAIAPDGGLLFDVALSGSGAPAAKNQAIYSTLDGSPDVTLGLQKGALVGTGGALGLPANAKIASLLQPIANQNSLGVFQATVSGTGLSSTSNRVLFKDDGSFVTPFFRTGTVIPSLDGAKLKTIHEVTQDPAEDVLAVSYTRTGGTPAATASTDSGMLFIDHTGSPVYNGAREGLTAFNGGGLFGQFRPNATLSQRIIPVFFAKFVPTGGKPVDAAFTHNERYGEIQGDDASILPGTEKLGAFLSVASSTTAIALRTTLTGSPVAENELIFDTSYNFMVRKGQTLQTAPPTGLKVAKILRYWLVEGDQLMLHVQLSGTGVTAKNNTALVLRHATGGNYLFLARTGSQAPGYPVGVTLAAISAVDVEPVNGHYAVLATLGGISATQNQALFQGQTSLGDDTGLAHQRLPRRVLSKGGFYTSPFTPRGTIKSIVFSPAADTTGVGARGLRQIINSNGDIVLTILGDRNSTELVVLEP